MVLNRLGSERHRRLAGDAIEALGIPVVGAVMRDPTLTLPERHLGLVQAGEHADIGAHIDRLADMVERSVDIDKVLGLMTPLESAGRRFFGGAAAARQSASRWRRTPRSASSIRMSPDTGAKQARRSLPFSPLADEAPDASCDVCWLPGGYPELHAGKLAAAAKFRDGMRRFAETKPVHGECGGFMVLGQGLVDAEGSGTRCSDCWDMPRASPSAR